MQRAEKKTNRFTDSNCFFRGINTMQEFSCTCNAVGMHVTYMVVTVNKIYEDLANEVLFFLLNMLL